MRAKDAETAAQCEAVMDGLMEVRRNMAAMDVVKMERDSLKQQLHTSQAKALQLQQTLQHSNLLGPGHAAAASTLPFPASSSMSNVLGAAVRNISLQKLSVQPGSSIKRNFALS